MKSLYVSGKTVAILCQMLETLGFNEHFHAYSVKKTAKQVFYIIESLAGPLPLKTLYTPDKGDLYIVLHYQV